MFVCNLLSQNLQSKIIYICFCNLISFYKIMFIEYLILFLFTKIIVCLIFSLAVWIRDEYPDLLIFGSLNPSRSITFFIGSGSTCNNGLIKLFSS